jgi:hypothetical protein
MLCGARGGCLAAALVPTREFAIMPGLVKAVDTAANNDISAQADVEAGGSCPQAQSSESSQNAPSSRSTHCGRPAEVAALSLSTGCCSRTEPVSSGGPGDYQQDDLGTPVVICIARYARLRVISHHNPIASLPVSLKNAYLEGPAHMCPRSSFSALCWLTAPFLRPVLHLKPAIG